MNATLNIDKAGRVVIPRPVRDELQLSAGDSLEREVSEDRITLRPARKGRMRNIQGVWVFDAGTGPMDANLPRRTLNRIRREREQKWQGTR